MLELHWDTLDNMTKEELLSNACLQEQLQHYGWYELDNWIKLIIIDSLGERSHKTVTIGP